MPDGKNAHAVRVDAVEDGVWKPLQVSLSPTERGEWKSLWIDGDGIQHGPGLGEELIAKMLLAAVIPFTGLIDLALHSLVVGQLHLRLREAK